MMTVSKDKATRQIKFSERHGAIDISSGERLSWSQKNIHSRQVVRSHTH